ncbi:UNVERIFIED_CONTAM: Berberine bridge enzyme-like 4 [Sesamum calycinum]|uniref:Berberine bridge enzyme-like 4 n=1 Tax=Sesamum calycinum TaxID=2727403 RepID=A0AAW2NUA8_9LAMI
MDRLLPLMQESFPKLGLVRKTAWGRGGLRQSCIPTSFHMHQLFEIWWEETRIPVHFTRPNQIYVDCPIPKYGLEGLWRFFYEGEAEDGKLVFTSYGGRIGEIPGSEILFPRRAENIYEIQRLVGSSEE